MSGKNGFEVPPLRAFKHDYIRTLRDRRYAAVVDPGRGPCSNACGASGGNCAPYSQPTTTPTTPAASPNCSRTVLPVCDPRGEPIPTLPQALAKGDEVQFTQLGLRFRVLDIPGRMLPIMAQIPSSAAICRSPAAAAACSKAPHRRFLPHSPGWPPFRCKCSPPSVNGRMSSERNRK